MIKKILKLFIKEQSSYEESTLEWPTLFDSLIGYSNPTILNKVKESTRDVINGRYAYERDSVLFSKVDYAWPELACLLSVAIKKGGTLDVLDFGGSLGSMYFQNRVIFDAIKNIRWSIVEQNDYVQAGRAMIKEDAVKFYCNIKDCLHAESPNVAMFSSSLQYLRNPVDVVRDINSSNIEYVYINKTPISNSIKNLSVIQNVPKNIYDASYPMTIFSKENFLNELWDGWDVNLSYINEPEGKCVTSLGKDFMWESFLLRRK
jgi:putative methyltransferase (TIGR04325 family)